MNSLINNGIYIQNKSGQPNTEKTVIVMGLARSGTSMVARVLDGLNVFLGNKKDNAVFEDVEIANALESNNLEEFKNLVEQRNNKYPIWGWKRPGSLNQVETIIQNTRNPHFIIVYRDLLSIALRNNISMEVDLHQSLKMATQTYFLINDFVATTKAPVMLVSYEKAITKKRNFIKTLAQYLDIETTPKTLADCAELIEIDRKIYLENSTINKVVAKVEKTENGVILFGNFPFRPNQNFEADLNINNHENSRKVSITPNQGTEINLNSNDLVKGFNIVKVTYKDEIHFQNSPMIFYNGKIEEKPKIFMFIHIPKTAGTSFRLSIEKEFVNQSFFPTTNEIKANNGQYPTFQQIADLPIERLNSLKFIAGHYPKSTSQMFPFRYNYITFFRNPEDRIVSNLIHFKAYDKNCMNLTLDEIFDLRKEKIINLQIKFILNNQAGIDDLLNLPENQFQQHMITLINQLHFFGLQERLSESIDLFNNTFGFKINLDKVRNPKKLNIEPSVDLMNKISIACKKEKLLYNAAENIFETRIANKLNG